MESSRAQASLPNELKENLISRIRSVVNPTRVILFGSAARGEMSRNSDVDVMVLMESLPPEHKRATWLTIYQAMWGFPLPLDVIVMDQADFETQRHRVGGLAYPVSREGVVIYG